MHDIYLYEGTDVLKNLLKWERRGLIGQNLVRYWYGDSSVLSIT